MKRFPILLITLCVIFTSAVVAKDPKIVALLPGHNDARFLPNCLRAIACYADAVVYLDDASDDNSIEIVQSLAKECRVEQIITKSSWVRNPAADRNILLQAGREIGGTHFILLDADEMFTANCMQDNKIRLHILSLKEGESLILNWVQLWRSLDFYRFDNSVWTWNYKDFAFCDDGVCSYAPGFLHEKRTPNDLKGMRWVIQGYNYGVLHFQFVNWENLLIKQAWYRCMERIHDPQRSVQQLNEQYGQSKDETNLGLLPAPVTWFEGYSFFDRSVFAQKELWRENDVMKWFATYGIEYFIGLDIWDISWPFEAYVNKLKSSHIFPSQLGQDCLVDTFIFQGKSEGVFIDIGAHDGYLFNNTYFLETARKWRGICIEPLQEPFKSLQKNRSAICINGCIGGQEGTADFFAVSGRPEQLSGLASTYPAVHKERLEREVAWYNGSYQVIKVPVYELNKVLENNGLREVDFISLDTEGSELEILKSIDFDKYHIRVLCVENNYNSEDVREFMKSNGFQKITYLCNQDDIYINTKLKG
jgi:FkbM family methyltransferase